MKITLQKTNRSLISSDGRIRGDLWEGETESGIPILCIIPLIAIRGEFQGEPFRKLQDQLTEEMTKTVEAFSNIPDGMTF